jgi:hypothetical protein
MAVAGDGCEGTRKGERKTQRLVRLEVWVRCWEEGGGAGGGRTSSSDSSPANTTLFIAAGPGAPATPRAFCGVLDTLLGISCIVRETQHLGFVV